MEIGLCLQAPCRLQEIVVVSEPALAPSAVECFVAGPTHSTNEAGRRRLDKRSLTTFYRGIDQRYNGSTTVRRYWSNRPSAEGVRLGIWILGSLNFLIVSWEAAGGEED